MLPPAALAPRMPPEIVPSVHAKLLAVEAVRGKLNDPHVVAEVVEVSTGVGFTVTVINVGVAPQDPSLLGEVGRTE